MKNIIRNKINDLEIQIKVMIKINQMNIQKQKENDLMMEVQGRQHQVVKMKVIIDRQAIDRISVVVQILLHEMNLQVENIKKNLNQKVVEIMIQKIEIQLYHHQNHGIIIMIDEIQQDLHQKKKTFNTSTWERKRFRKCHRF